MLARQQPLLLGGEGEGRDGVLMARQVHERLGIPHIVDVDGTVLRPRRHQATRAAEA